MSRLVVFYAIVLFSATLLFAAGGSEDAAVSPMRVRTLQGCTFLHRSIETDPARSAGRIAEEMEALAETMRDARITPAGTPIVVLHNPTAEAGKTFKVEMGFPVDPGVKPPANSDIRRLEPMRAATLTCNGPVSAMEEAYRDLYQQIGQAGLTPAEEVRQYSLYWEGADSPNNVMLLQVKLAE